MSYNLYLHSSKKTSVLVMELTEKERLMLVEKKEEIRKLTMEILDMLNDPEKEIESKEIKKRITSILSLLSTIASYSKSKNYDLNRLTNAANIICVGLDLSKEVLIPAIEVFCNIVNSVRFDFTKSGIKIHIPKIDFSIFKQVLEG